MVLDRDVVVSARAKPARRKGLGWFLHDDPRDRPPPSFAGTHTVYCGGDRASYLLLPGTPATRSPATVQGG